MSLANAAARKRRAPPSTPTQPIPIPPPAQQTRISQNINEKPNVLTIQQVIMLIDSRLTKLEKEFKDNGAATTTPQIKNTVITTANEPDTAPITDYVSEFNDRFEMLLQEITRQDTELKNLTQLLLQLQSYTMTVNKQLLENKAISISEELMEYDEGITESIDVIEGDVAIQSIEEDIATTNQDDVNETDKHV